MTTRAPGQNLLPLVLYYSSGAHLTLFCSRGKLLFSPVERIDTR